MIGTLLPFLLSRQRHLYHPATHFSPLPLRFMLHGILILMAFSCPTASAVELTDLTLPVYNVTMDPEHLAYLLENWESEEQFSAIIEYKGVEYSGEFALRGATARSLPKKSFQLYFPTPGPNGAYEINLNSEYRDLSMTRNYLAMFLAKRLGLHAPVVRHVSLMINGEYFGVYNEIEEVDDTFFEARDLQTPPFLVRALRHGGAFVPMLDPEAFYNMYSFYSTTPANLDTFAVRRMLFQFGSREEVARHSGRILNLDNVVSYYAMQYAISNYDGFTKNFFLLEDPSGRYSMIPWDCDSSFGNNWRGIWDSNFITVRFYMPIEQAPLFVRLMEQEYLKQRFRDLLETIRSTDFTALHAELHVVKALIRHDVELDGMRDGTIDDFDTAFNRLHWFLNDRSDVLAENDILNQAYIDEYHLSFVEHEDDDDEENEVLITAEIVGNPAIAQVCTGVVFPFETHDLHDDGEDGDAQAGDGIWSIELECEDDDSAIYYYFSTRNALNMRYNFPPSGQLYFDQQPCRILSFPTNKANVPHVEELTFGPGYESIAERSRLVSIVNTSDNSISLAGVHLVLDSPHNQISLSACDDLQPGDTLFIASDPDLERARAPWRIVFGPFPLHAENVEDLHLISFDGSLLDTSPISFAPVTEQIGAAVINEICYHPSESEMFNSGDWVEIVFADTISTIEGWMLRDEKEVNEYIFTIEDNDRRLSSNDYLVLAEDTAVFRNVYPDSIEVSGPLGFRLSNDGDAVRLYNASGQLVDQVRYLDSAPWPTGADGSGRTLELINPDSLNAGPEHWHPSLYSHPLGTPGRRNSITDPPPVDPHNPIANDWTILSVQPNPTNSIAIASVNIPNRGFYTITCFNILGQQVSSQKYWADQAAVIQVPLSFADMASGIYIARLSGDNYSNAYKIVVMK
ncbi:inner spore coat protein H [bacterium BMS3Bbin04]|nr:inner spore coat protein H [bacterium BMS3Bbin04]